MQFRRQGSKIQCIRSTYSTELKRCKQKLIATVEQDLSDLPSDIPEILTATEVAELKNYLANLAIFKERQAKIAAILAAPGALDAIAVALMVHPDQIDQAGAHEIYVGLAKVAKALKKIGYPKSTTTSKE